MIQTKIPISKPGERTECGLADLFIVAPDASDHGDFAEGRAAPDLVLNMRRRQDSIGQQTELQRPLHARRPRGIAMLGEYTSP